MAKKVINIGVISNDGTGSTLRAGAQIINDNFTEIYDALGGTDGSPLSFVSSIVAGPGVLVSTPAGQVIVRTAVASDTTLGAIKLGNGLSIDNDGVVSSQVYSLPSATYNTLGGIKVGNNLTIDNEGVLSAIQGPYTLPTASSDTLGGIKVGAGLAIADGVLSAPGSVLYELPISSDQVLGGIKVGAGLDIAVDGTLDVVGQTGDIAFNFNLMYTSGLEGGLTIASYLTEEFNSVPKITLPSANDINTVPIGIEGKNAGVEITSVNPISSEVYSWYFNSNSELTLPGSLKVSSAPEGSIIGEGGVSINAKNGYQFSAAYQRAEILNPTPGYNANVAGFYLDGNGATIEINTDDTGSSWHFRTDGVLQLPVSGDIIDSNGDSILTSGTSLPSQTGNDGKFLTTDGTTLSWATLVSGVFDQPLNTTDAVEFNTVTASEFISTATGVPTLSSSTNINLQAENAVVVIGSPFRLGYLTTTQRNTLTPVNGDLIYNTTLEKIQGYQNGIWINLDGTP